VASATLGSLIATTDVERRPTIMHLTPERIEELRRELRALPPSPCVRNAATKIEAVEKIAPELLALRRMGYGLNTLSAELASKGLTIAPRTLKNYLRHCGATLRKRRRTRTVTATAPGELSSVSITKSSGCFASML
jgi:hypothetical protein